MKISYPTLPVAEAHRIAPEFLQDGWRPLTETEVVWAGTGRPLSVDRFEVFAASIESDRQAFLSSAEKNDRDLFEGRVSGLVHAELSGTPVLVLDDPAFWRYLSFAHFWDLIVWRESAAFAKGDLATLMKYLDGNNVTESVLTRMYIRGQIALEHGGYELAWSVPGGTDFWRSHVLRVRVGTAPVLAREFVRAQSTDRMSTDDLRQYARRLNRLGTNLVLPALGEADAGDLIGELRD